ncbi:MAG: hypothetical protein KAJ90_03330, partial [Desulfobacterales bacterium]|nr:hypothetical protein [Desulfobacterales bacterium]
DRTNLTQPVSNLFTILHNSRGKASIFDVKACRAITQRDVFICEMPLRNRDEIISPFLTDSVDLHARSRL